MGSEKESPLISCITPTFNRAHLLPRAIESSINQTYPHWEMIIVDDGSKDNTEEVVHSYMETDRRIKYFKNPGKGGNAARNYGLKQAQGEWVVFLDDDDENLPERLEKQLYTAQKGNTEFLLSGYQTIDMQGNILNYHIQPLGGKGAGIGIRWFIKKELIFKAGLFDETMPAMQEVELSMRIAEFYNFSFHPEVVVSARQTTTAIHQGQNGINGAIMLIEKHAEKMDVNELAWWYYKVALGYAHLQKSLHTINYLKLAGKHDKKNKHKPAVVYYKLMGWVTLQFIHRVGAHIVKKILAKHNVNTVKHPLL